ncbi:hypothetical protein [Bifidobacterium saguini]|uniref:hypothetical protein n=1 Tax=Bifidobacterium saguini TaxID=762210 RepID=UPI001FAEA456|nr:hypothetical protein [Bifidobacterium saguini]
MILICALGVIVVNHQNPSADRKPETAVTETGSAKGSRPTQDDWAGLKAAGIPVPGSWSERTKAFPVSTDGNGAASINENGKSVILDDGGAGPIDTALETVNAILDPNGSDDDWRSRVLDLIGDDGAGNGHPISDAPRWWWTQRRFQADSVCSGQSDATYISYAYECSTDGTWPGSDEDAIQSNPFYTAAETSFPVPDGLSIPSTSNPQLTVSRAYDTVLIPMDDGNWHVTVYCPASLDGPLLDKHSNETEAPKAGKESYTVVSATGYGTRQRPCRTVEVVVGGQKPFWSLKDTR